MTDHSRMKLGKRPPRVDSRSLRLAKYLGKMPTPPDSEDWTKGITSWGMMANDTLGDCTIAACGHAVQVWTANLGGEITLPDRAIIQAYQDWDGYNPSDPNSDRGGVEVDVLNNWRKSSLAGHEIMAYAELEPHNILHVKLSVLMFGGLYIGLALPLTAQTQDTWDVADNPGFFKRLFRKIIGMFLPMFRDPAAPGSWGGHAVFVPAYNSTGPVCITWGQLKQMTWAFWSKYCDEAHAILSKDWVTASGSPPGFDLATLQADLKAVTG